MADEQFPEPGVTPYDRIGGEAAVRALVERFYDAMDQYEPEALFLIGWLGGPQDYMRQHGHPRLRMRHAHVPVNVRLRDAWLRCMRLALAATPIDPASRAFLDEKLTAVADFLRNQPD
jgi:hemoglobin